MRQGAKNPDHAKWLLAILLTWLTSVSACSSSSHNSPADDESGTNPSMPVDLNYTVQAYEAELFWTASTDDGVVVGYDIIRDGVPVIELVDATSFVDTMLEPATGYTYSVIAVDDEGNQSTPASIELTTLEEQSLPLISLDNHLELLRAVFDVYTGNSYFPLLSTLPDWSDPQYTAFPDPPANYPYGEPYEQQVTCSNGGTAVMLYEYFGSFGYSADLDFTLDDCQDGEALLDGWIKRYDAGGHGGSLQQITAVDLSIVDPGRELYFSSGPTREFGISEYAYYDTTRSAHIDTLSLTTGDTTWELTDVDTNISGGAIWWTLSGTFTARAAWTGGHLLYAEADLGTTAAGIDLYDTGGLTLAGEDGSRLVLNAGNGDSDTVSIDITLPDGQVETVSEPWSLWADHLRYEKILLRTWFPEYF